MTKYELLSYIVGFTSATALLLGLYVFNKIRKGE